MHSILLKLFICICAVAIVCDTQPNQAFLRNRRARFCGRQLADALAMVCYSVYYMPREERSEPAKALIKGPGGPLWHPADPKNSGIYNLQHFGGTTDNSNSHPNSLQNGGQKPPFFIRKTRQGIVNECCRNSCSVQQLQAYCGSPVDEDYEEE